MEQRWETIMEISILILTVNYNTEQCKNGMEILFIMFDLGLNRSIYNVNNIKPFRLYSTGSMKARMYTLSFFGQPKKKAIEQEWPLTN